MSSPTFDPTQIESPFKVTLSFKKLIANVREMISTGDNPIIARGMDDFLGHINHLDALTGSIAVDEYDEYIDDIELLLCLLFPHPLTHNEIKAATPPIQPDILYRSERFTKVFGEVSKLIPKEFDSMDEDRIYILMCNYLLQAWYGINMYASRSPVYDVVDTQGITRHYKSTYNVDFVDIIPPANPPTMSPELIQQLKHDFDNVRLWKEIFPPGSWELSGFGIRSFVDVSGEEALSRLKNLLIDQRAMQKAKDAERIMNPLFRTLIGIPDLEATFTMFDQSRGVFLRPSDDKPSISLGNMVECSSDTLLCSASSSRVFAERKPFFVQNVDQLPPEAAEITIHRHVMDQGYKSYVLVPVHFEDEMLGVLEFASYTPDALSPALSDRINDILSICRNAVKSFSDDWNTNLTAIVQNEYTAIHPSVAWKFREMAGRIAENKLNDNPQPTEDIVFSDLTALYGQSDISHSSSVRNDSISADLKTQVEHVREVLDVINGKVDMPLVNNVIYQTNIIYEKLSSDLAAGMEQQVTDFLREHINPLFRRMQERDSHLNESVSTYFDHLHEGMDIIYDKRRDFDNSIEMINKQLSDFIDERQITAQGIYPHYFERYKTDGVEHNMFIGPEIAPAMKFDKLYLENLRLWQVKTMAEMERLHAHHRSWLPLPMEIASLIMVYSNPLSIRYRMDEKQFDVDGAYNARYEIIKKRIDKAHIKGTTERITQPGKIVIVYTQPSDLDEYLNFANYLSYEGLLQGRPETFDIEDLQGVIGLKGLRISVNYSDDTNGVKVKKPVSMTQERI